jgi:type II secretory pathway pseudopilin PulG
MTRQRGLFVRMRAQLHDERGFTMVEAMVAGLVLAIGAFGIAQSLQFGLKTTGIARQRTAAEALANQQLELARALNYDNVVLRQDQPINHDPDPDSPDYWVTDGTPPTYDPDGAASIPSEPVLSQDVFPSLLHYQSDVTQGNTTFTVFTYVTWVDSPTDGLGANDVGHDWDDDGTIDDANGEDQKRVTIVVTWPNSFGTVVSELKISSLFSTGSIAYQEGDSAPNQPPAADCPEFSVNGLTASFTAHATDVDGTVDRIDWDFGDGNQVTGGGVNRDHTYAQPGDYVVTNTAFDNQGATASSSMSCPLVTVVASETPGGAELSCEIVIENGAPYATSQQVTLYLNSLDDQGSAATDMQLSTDGTNFGASLDYSSTTLYTLTAGDGQKTVYVRFLDADSDQSPVCSNSITLDTTPPGAPSSLLVNRASNKKSATLQWTAPAPVPSFAGYQVWRRSTTSATWMGPPQFVCTFTSTTACTDSNQDNHTNYEYYVVAVDSAGNQSAQSNHVTV